MHVNNDSNPMRVKERFWARAQRRGSTVWRTRRRLIRPSSTPSSTRWDRRSRMVDGGSR